MGPVHWDEVEGHRREKGPMAATWQYLGDAAGAKGIGLNRDPHRPGPALDAAALAQPHGGDLLRARGLGALWQDEAVCEVGAGDTIVQLADHYEHTLQGRARRARVPRLRHAASGRVRLAAALERSAARLLWTEGRVDDPWESRPRSASSSSPSRASGRRTSSRSRTSRSTTTATGRSATRRARSGPG